MYAIIRAGGKQAKVRSGDVIEVERLKNAGDTVEFRPLLVVDDDGNTHSDASALDDATVSARVLGETKGDKVDIFKYKSKTGYRRHQGHRQTYTQLEITEIAFGGKKKAAPKRSKKSEEAPADTEEQVAEAAEQADASEEE